MNHSHKSTNKGFTLLEILLVIAAIGVLAAIVLVAINPTRQINQARQSVINSDKNTIEKALQQRLIDTGQYPAGLDGVQRKVCSNAITTDCVNLNGLISDYISAIPSSTTYTVARGNDGRVYVNTTETAANLTCPTGYIKVPGNSLYQTKDFCVMKYEAKAVEIINPTVGLNTPNTGANSIANNITATTSANERAIASVASGLPLANITQIQAIDYCANQNTVSGSNLITNAEWMTIARNIEAQSTNWRDGVIGSTESLGGGLYIGHSDESSDNNILEASEDDNNGYFGTGNEGTSDQKRTHILSNGEVIWDLGANVWEWTSDTILFKDQPYALLSGGFTWKNYTDIINYGIWSPDLWRPSNSEWGEGHNIGAIRVIGLNSLNSMGAVSRGGSMRGVSPYPKFSGIYFANASRNPSTSIDDGGGFRCVVR